MSAPSRSGERCYPLVQAFRRPEGPLSGQSIRVDEERVWATKISLVFVRLLGPVVFVIMLLSRRPWMLSRVIDFGAIHVLSSPLSAAQKVSSLSHPQARM